jgi:hypothetical protein
MEEAVLQDSLFVVFDRGMQIKAENPFLFIKKRVFLSVSLMR